MFAFPGSPMGTPCPQPVGELDAPQKGAEELKGGIPHPSPHFTCFDTGSSYTGEREDLHQVRDWLFEWDSSLKGGQVAHREGTGKQEREIQFGLAEGKLKPFQVDTACMHSLSRH